MKKIIRGILLFLSLSFFSYANEWSFDFEVRALQRESENIKSIEDVFEISFDDYLTGTLSKLIYESNTNELSVSLGVAYKLARLSLDISKSFDNESEDTLEDLDFLSYEDRSKISVMSLSTLETDFQSTDLQLSVCIWPNEDFGDKDSMLKVFFNAGYLSQSFEYIASNVRQVSEGFIFLYDGIAITYDLDFTGWYYGLLTAIQINENIELNLSAEFSQSMHFEGTDHHVLRNFRIKESGEGDFLRLESNLSVKLFSTDKFSCWIFGEINFIDMDLGGRANGVIEGFLFSGQPVQIDGKQNISTLGLKMEF